MIFDQSLYYQVATVTLNNLFIRIPYWIDKEACFRHVYLSWIGDRG